jgi:hypothetical protein
MLICKTGGIFGGDARVVMMTAKRRGNRVYVANFGCLDTIQWDVELPFELQ